MSKRARTCWRHIRRVRPRRATSGIGQLVEGVDDLLGDRAGPRRASVLVHRAELLVACQARVTSQPGSPASSPVLSLASWRVGQVLAAAAQQAADLVQRVVLVAAPAQGVLLDAAADLVDDLGAEPDDMERVEHRDRVVTRDLGHAVQYVKLQVWTNPSGALIWAIAPLSHPHHDHADRPDGG